jgi:glycosyltransferase involved in cell wall biosynthesis
MPQAPITLMTPSSALFLTPRWIRNGGVGAHIQSSAALLARHGLHVRVLAARVEPGEQVPGVTVEHRPQLLDARASMQTRIGETAAADVIHLHQLDDPKMVEFMQLKAPVVVSAHGYSACPSGVYYFRPGQMCTRSHGLGCVPNLVANGCAHTRYPKTLPLKYIRSGRALKALRRADLAVSYSGAVDRHLAANGVGARAIVPYFPTMAPALGSEDANRRRVVFAGRIVATKGVDVLIRAAQQVNGEIVICGDGGRLDEMRALARELDLEDRVHFKGWLDPDQLARELADASAVVVPSLWPEPFGIVGIEAFAAGRPAVGSATGGIPEWLQDGVTGICVSPGDELELARALDELLADPDKQHAMGLAGKELVATHFSEERHLEALLEAYQRAGASWRAQTPS